MIENYEDDSVWESYVPEIGGVYSEGAWRSKDEEVFRLNGWKIQKVEPVFNPYNESILYRRRKAEAKPEPADDGIHTRVIELAVGDAFTPIAVRIDDNGAGEFVTVRESIPTMEGVLSIDVSEWPALRAAIDRLIAECRD
jgi:hypothetical protein